MHRPSTRTSYSIWRRRLCSWAVSVRQLQARRQLLQDTVACPMWCGNIKLDQLKAHIRSLSQQPVLLSHQQQRSSAPCNTEQIKNALHRQRITGRLTQDALYNLHEFAYNADFVRHILTFPDLEVITYNRTIMDIFKTLLQSSSTSGKPSDAASIIGVCKH